MILNLQAIAEAPVSHDPFDFFIARDVLPPDWKDAISDDFPRVPGTGSYPMSALSAGATFQSLIEELSSEPFAHAVGGPLGCDLTGLTPLVTIRGRSGPKDGFVHTDAAWKIVTALLYLNPTWQDDGGRLRLLRSSSLDDVAVEVPPAWGTLIAFRRSDRSYHGHRPFYGERRLVQVAWADPAYVRREERRHRRSALIKRLAGAFERRPTVPDANRDR